MMIEIADLWLDAVYGYGGRIQACTIVQAGFAGTSEATPC